MKWYSTALIRKDINFLFSLFHCRLNKKRLFFSASKIKRRWGELVHDLSRAMCGKQKATTTRDIFLLCFHNFYCSTPSLVVCVLHPPLLDNEIKYRAERENIRKIVKTVNHCLTWRRVLLMPFSSLFFHPKKSSFISLSSLLLLPARKYH